MAARILRRTHRSADQRNEVHVLIIGSPEDARVEAAILQAVRNKGSIWSAVGEVNLEALPELLAKSALFVGNTAAHII